MVVGGSVATSSFVERCHNVALVCALGHSGRCNFWQHRLCGLPDVFWAIGRVSPNRDACAGYRSKMEVIFARPSSVFQGCLCDATMLRIQCALVVATRFGSTSEKLQQRVAFPRILFVSPSNAASRCCSLQLARFVSFPRCFPLELLSD